MQLDVSAWLIESFSSLWFVAVLASSPSTVYFFSSLSIPLLLTPSLQAFASFLIPPPSLLVVSPSVQRIHQTPSWQFPTPLQSYFPSNLVTLSYQLLSELRATFLLFNFHHLTLASALTHTIQPVIQTVY